MVTLGWKDYSKGAKERLSEAQTLLRAGQFGGSIYLAGRAVEGMLRALIWKRDLETASGRRSLDAGHDLSRLLTIIEDLGTLQNYSSRDALKSEIQRIGRLWLNNMRYMPESRINRLWFEARVIGGRRTLKSEANGFCKSCSAVVRQCEELCYS